MSIKRRSLLLCRTYSWWGEAVGARAAGGGLHLVKVWHNMLSAFSSEWPRCCVATWKKRRRQQQWERQHTPAFLIMFIWISCVRVHWKTEGKTGGTVVNSVAAPRSRVRLPLWCEAGRSSNFLPQSKDVNIRLIRDSKNAHSVEWVVVCASVWPCAELVTSPGCDPSPPSPPSRQLVWVPALWERWCRRSVDGKWTGGLTRELWPVQLWVEAAQLVIDSRSFYIDLLKSM